MRYSAKEILAAVAKQLGNTPAVCKKSYVHPAVLALGSALAGKKRRHRRHLEPEVSAREGARQAPICTQRKPACWNSCGDSTGWRSKRSKPEPQKQNAQPFEGLGGLGLY